MKNIELKIKIDGFKKVASIFKKIGAKFKGKLYQVDIYYNCPKGRLKIREINKRNFELIFYQRPDKSASKVSNYQILNIKAAQLENFKSIFNFALGEKTVVKKERELWLYKNTRVHLDKVSGLGSFLELETVAKKIDTAQAKKECQEVVKLLNLTKYRKLDKSYSDMLSVRAGGRC